MEVNPKSLLREAAFIASVFSVPFAAGAIMSRA